MYFGYQGITPINRERERAGSVCLIENTDGMPVRQGWLPVLRLGAVVVFLVVVVVIVVAALSTSFGASWRYVGAALEALGPPERGRGLRTE